MESNYKDYFKSKKITIIGLGLLGRGINDAIFLAECGTKLTITDLRGPEMLAISIKKLKKFKNISYTLGHHDLKDFEDRDLILKAASVPIDSIYIRHAREKGIPIEMDASLFVRLLSPERSDGGQVLFSPNVTVVGVTGTRGKTTTSSMIFEILKKYYRGKRKKVYLAGNIQDTATLPLVKKVKRGDIVVLELDSWQLQGFGDSKISPHIAVFTSFYSDHLNYYNNNMGTYLDDKTKIFLNQKRKDILLVSEQAYKKAVISYRQKIRSKVVVVKKEKLSLQIPGEHNITNASLALETVEKLGISRSFAVKALKKFKGVPGRLQFLKKVKDVSIWNDTTSTTPEAAIAGLRALKGRRKNIILVCGGTDKNLSMKRFAEEMKLYCKAVAFLEGTGTERFRKTYPLPSFPASKIKEFNNLENAVKWALNQCDKGDHLLFSPAFASFGMFLNEYDRGQKFVEIISRL